MEAYRDDLAYIHDTGFGGFARGATPFLLETFRKASISRGLVIDLGSGSGIWARALADAGYDVLGIDISPAMVELARARVPEGEFRIGSALKVDLPGCIAVTSMGECLNYLFDPDNSKKQLKTVFRRVHAALRPGGLFIFDVAQPGRGTGPKTKYVQGEDWGVVVQVEENKKTRRLTRDIISYRKVGDLYHRDQETHQLQLYKTAELARELRRIGFRVRLLKSYGKHCFPRAYGAVLARKPLASGLRLSG